MGRAGARRGQPAGVLDRLRAPGFHDGITPERRAIGPMHALLPTLLAAFGP